VTTQALRIDVHCQSTNRSASVLTARINTFASLYLPYDSDEPLPTNEVRDIIDYCHSSKKQVVIGCVANAHHTLSGGGTGTNPRRKGITNFW
jgi:hypothetical protein